MPMIEEITFGLAAIMARHCASKSGRTDSPISVERAGGRIPYSYDLSTPVVQFDEAYCLTER